MSRRMERVNELLREEISKIISRDIKDPRLSSIVSITHVDTSVDMKYAKVLVSVLGNDQDKERSLKALDSASGFVHRELRGKVRLRHIPTISFRLDDSIERSDRLFKLIKQGLPSENDKE